MQTQVSPTLLAQPAHLLSLWSKLINNAMRHTASGQIWVRLTEGNGEVLTTVKLPFAAPDTAM